MIRRCLPLLMTAAALVAQTAPKAAPILGVDPAYLDRTVKPCEDFYRFANGAFDQVPIPGAYSDFGVNQEIDIRSEALVKAILEEAARDRKAVDGSPSRRIGDFYRSGMDEAGIARAGIGPLRPVFRAIDRVSAQGLVALMGSLHRQGVRAGFSFYVGQDEKESTRIIAQFGQGGLGLPEREFYFRDDETTRAQRAAYVKHIARMFALAGRKDAPAAAARVLALETRLAKVSKKLVDLRDPQGNYHKVARTELAALAPGFAWDAYFEAVGLPASETHVIVAQPEYFKGLGVELTGTPVAEWREYLRWNVLRANAQALPKAFEDEAFAFYGKALSGRKEQHPRWKRVMGAADQAVGFEIGKLFVKRAFSADAKAEVLAMVRFHQEALRQSIGRATWMGEATKAQALRKLETMVAKVGYPDVWRDYTGLQVKGQPFVLNVVAGRAFEFQRRMQRLGKPVDRTEWGMTPQTNNAYYNPTLNEICLPAGILQPPFFDVKLDAASNYGALASTIGHEILHGFDDQGSQYDAEGNLKNWWTAEDRKAYDAQTDQVVKQYDGYEPLPGVHILGKQTLGENLADIGGLKISFEAWKLATAGKPQPSGEGLTPEQRFFVAFAQGWRTNTRPESERLRIQSDVHSPVRWRVLGPVSALPEFQRAFGCGAADPMAAREGRRFLIW